MDTQTLQKIGLSPKEATLYVTCAEAGPTKAREIARYTGINRGTVYDIAHSLINKGLMSTIERGHRTYFSALPLDRFIAHLHERITTAEAAVPTVMALLRSTSYRPKLRFFEGVEGIKLIYEETLSCKTKTMIQFVSVREMIESVGIEFMRAYVAKRAKRQIKLRAINAQIGEINDTQWDFSSHTNSRLLRQTRIAPKKIQFPAMMMVYDDFITLMSTKRENFGFILESPAFANMLRSIFEMVWSVSRSA